MTIVPGELTGQSSVTHDGAFNHTLDLPVPPGRLDMAPELQLSYSSRGGNGLLGVGWSLSTLSAITVCERKLAADGVVAGVDYRKPAYCLNGRKLIATSPLATIFYPESDDGSRIEKSGDSFVVYLKNGRVLHYGDTSMSPFSRVNVDVDGAAFPATWFLSRVADRYGNTIDYRYERTTGSLIWSDSPQEHRLASVRYTGTAQAPGDRFVSFLYEARPDPQESFAGGFRITTSKRLKTIKTAVPSGSGQRVVSQYRLTYGQGRNTNGSLLTSIQRCDGGTRCFAPTQLSWNTELGFDGGHDKFVNVSSTTKNYAVSWRQVIEHADLPHAVASEPPRTLFHNKFAARMVLVDINGDGWDDLVYNTRTPRDVGKDDQTCEGQWMDDGAKVFARISTGIGFGSAIDLSSAFRAKSRFTRPGWKPNFDPYRTQYADLNNDGAVDLLAWGSFADDDGFKALSFANNRLSPIGGLFRAQRGSYSTLPIALGDFGGDGLVDALAVHMHGTVSALYWHWHDSVFSPAACGDDLSICYRVRSDEDSVFTDVADHGADDVRNVLDLDGDGRVELVKGAGFPGYWGATNIDRLAQQLPQWDWVFADINGDGLKDTVSLDGDDRFVAQINTGTELLEYDPYDGPPVISELQDGDYATRDRWAGAFSSGVRVADFNGDGRDDLLFLEALPFAQEQCNGYLPLTPPPTILFSDGRKFHAVRLPAAPGKRLRHVGLLPDDAKNFPHVTTGDINGDGRAEILELAQVDTPAGPRFEFQLRSWQASTSSSAAVPEVEPTEVLVGIRTGMARATTETETIDYAMIGSPSAADVHVPAQECEYPLRCLKRGLTVVRAHLSKARALDGAQALTYNYVGGQSDVKGRGLLGFQEVVETDPERGIRTSTTYSHARVALRPMAELGGNIPHGRYAYPYAALPSMITTEVSSSLRSDASQVVGDEERKTAVTSKYRVKEARNGFFVERYETTTDEFDSLTATTPARRTIQKSTLDNFLNVTYSSREIVGGDFDEVSTTYFNDSEMWLIGRPARVTSTSRVGTAQQSRTVDHKYDAGGSLRQVIIEPTSTDNDVWLETTIVRTNTGVPQRIEQKARDGALRITKMTPTSDGVFPQSLENAMGHTALVAYDAGHGGLTTRRDANGLTTTYEYDGFGRVTRIVPPDRAAQTTDYLSAPAVSFGALTIKETSPDGSGAETDVDTVGRVREVRERALDGKWLHSVQKFDTAGRSSQTSLPVLNPVNVASWTRNFQWVTQSYDNLDRKIATTSPDATALTWTYPSFFEVTSFDELGDEHRSTLDVNGRLTTAAQVLNGSGPARELKLSYSYSPFGNLKDATRHNGVATAGTSHHYDVLGRVRAVSDSDQGARGYYYNAFGDVRRSTDANEDSTMYDRDALGRPKTVTTVDGQARFVWDSEWLGALDRMWGYDGIVTSFDHDDKGRLERKSWSVDEESYEFQQSYDEHGRALDLTYPAVANRARLAVRHAYLNGHLKKVTDVASSRVYWEAVLDQPTLLREKVGESTTDWTFNATNGRLTDIVTKRGAAGIQALHYDYYDDGEVQRRVDTSARVTDSFGYDSVGRLTSWGRGTRTEAYSYDDLGSMTKVVLTAGSKSTTTNYAYDRTNLAGPTAPTAYGNLSYRYDSLGRRISTYIGAALQQTVVYNSLNLPRSITQGATETTFQYDAFGRRVRKVSGTSSVITIDDLFERRLNSGSPAADTSIHYVFGGGRRVAQVAFNSLTSTEVTSYLHADAIGSASVVSYHGSTTVDRLHYSPYGERTDAAGNPLTSPPGSGQRRGFTDHEHDDELGYINMRGRVYDARARKFLTPDPLVSDPTSSVAFNRYAYALNSPLRYSDPSGLCSVGASQFATGSAMPSGANGGLPSSCENVDDPSSDGTGWVDNAGTITADAGSDPGSKPFEKDNDGPGTSADSSIQPFGIGTTPIIPAPPTFLDVLGGFGLGVMRGFLPGATFLPDMPGSASYEAARQIGELVGSIGAIIQGGALAAGGGLLTVTVGGAVVGVPAAAVGASLAAVGVGNLLNSMRKMNASAKDGGGRGRFRKGKDDLEQLEGVQQHRGQLKPSGRAAEGEKTKESIRSTKKSEQRVDNRLKRLENLEDALDEFGD